MLPMIIMTFFFALRGQIVAHRKIAKWTFPIWLYVSVTGVVLYIYMYQLFPQHLKRLPKDAQAQEQIADPASDAKLPAGPQIMREITLLGRGSTQQIRLNKKEKIKVHGLRYVKPGERISSKLFLLNCLKKHSFSMVQIHHLFPQYFACSLMICKLMCLLLSFTISA